MPTPSSFIPGNPLFHTIRPLNKGIQLHLPPQLSEEGSLQNAQSFQATPGGLLRREAHQRYAGSTQVDYPPIQSLEVFFDSTTGLQKTVVIDQKFIYTLASATFVPKYWVYDTGTITATASDETITGSGTTWTDGLLQQGDVIVLDLDGSSNGPEVLEVDSITDNTHLETKIAPVNSHAAGSDYEIRRAFKPGEGRYVDSVVTADNEMIFVDGSRVPYKFDGTDFTTLDAGITTIPESITYFRDRLYYGKVTVSGNEYRYRITWSEPGVFDDIPVINYLDLPYQTGEIITLKPMGNTLVAFFKDAVYIGVPSQMPNLPIYFQRIDTGNVGLVGMKAVVNFFDSLFFVGQDDIYQLSTQGLTPIGTPIVRNSLKEASDLTKIYAVVDSVKSRVIFGFPKSSSNIEELWTYDYRSKAWGMEKVTCESLSDAAIYQGYTIDGLDSLSATIDGLDTYFNSIDSMTYINEGSYDIYPTVDGRLEYFLAQTTDEGGARITSIIETQDYDLSKPGYNKVWSGLSFKIESPIASDITYTIEGSVDRGVNWKSLGTLTVNAGDTEGKTSFKLFGGIGRFKLTSSTDNEQYIVNEILLKTKLRGKEVRF